MCLVPRVCALVCLLCMYVHASTHIGTCSLMLNYSQGHLLNVCMYVCMYVYEEALKECTCVCVYVYIHTCNECIHIHMGVNMICMHVYMCVCMHVSLR